MLAHCQVEAESEWKPQTSDNLGIRGSYKSNREKRPSSKRTNNNVDGRTIKAAAGLPTQTLTTGAVIGTRSSTSGALGHAENEKEETTVSPNPSKLLMNTNTNLQIVSGEDEEFRDSNSSVFALFSRISIRSISFSFCSS
jgi:hypothetical protein